MGTECVLGVFLTLFGVQDLISGRISRYLTGAALLAGLLLRREAMAAGILAGILFFPLFLFRMMGAADVKVIAVIIGFLGPVRGTAAVGTGFLLGAFWSLARLLRKGILLQRLSYFFAYIRQLPGSGICKPYYLADRDGTEPAIPLAFCLSAGTGLWFLADILRIFGR